MGAICFFFASLIFPSGGWLPVAERHEGGARGKTTIADRKTIVLFRVKSVHCPAITRPQVFRVTVYTNRREEQPLEFILTCLTLCLTIPVNLDVPA